MNLLLISNALEKRGFLCQADSSRIEPTDRLADPLSSGWVDGMHAKSQPGAVTVGDLFFLTSNFTETWLKTRGWQRYLVDAGDIAQECYLATSDKVAEDPRSYAATCVRNNVARRATRRLREQPADDPTSFDNIAVAGDDEIENVFDPAVLTHAHGAVHRLAEERRPELTKHLDAIDAQPGRNAVSVKWVAVTAYDTALGHVPGTASPASAFTRWISLLHSACNGTGSAYAELEDYEATLKRHVKDWFVPIIDAIPQIPAGLGRARVFRETHGYPRNSAAVDGDQAAYRAYERMMFGDKTQHGFVRHGAAGTIGSYLAPSIHQLVFSAGVAS